MNKAFPLALLSLVLLASCAKDNTQSTGEKARDHFNLWAATNYPDLQIDETGILILENTPGTGDAWNSDYAYVLCEATVGTTAGAISSTTSMELAKQLGTYSEGNFYGPRYQQVGVNASYAGVDAILGGMRIGGHRKAAVPAWLLTTARYDSKDDYISNCTGSTHFIYDITLLGMTDDISAMEKDSLRNYVTRVSGADQQPTTYTEADPDGNLYFISDSTAFIGTEKRSSTASLQLNYTGRLLNGQVFDTNIERVAKDNNIYDPTRTYGPATISFAEDYTNITMDGNSVIDGFKGSLSLMKWPGQTAVALFASCVGYSSSGSGDRIPAYSPLIFELELLK